MSQQEMNYDDSHHDSSTYTGYEGIPPYNNFSTGMYGQKLSAQGIGKTPSPAQRLALAIVSLVLWMVLFFIVLIGMVSISPGNPASGAIYPLLIVGLLIFSALVFVLNSLFNLKR
jgi:hypothetical protein